MVETNYNLIPKSFYETEGGKQELTVDKKLADAVQAGIQERLDDLPDAGQRGVFLEMTRNLAPGDVDTEAKLDGVLDTFELAAKLVTADGIPSVYIGDIAEFLARAMIKSEGQERANALNGRFAAHAAAKADLESQADKSKAAADKMERCHRDARHRRRRRIGGRGRIADLRPRRAQCCRQYV